MFVVFSGPIGLVEGSTNDQRKIQHRHVVYFFDEREKSNESVVTSFHCPCLNSSHAISDRLTMEYLTDINESTSTAGKMSVTTSSSSIFRNRFLLSLSSLCCQCGVLIDPNALNMCSGCMQTQIDITELIPKQGQLQMCNKCIR